MCPSRLLDEESKFTKIRQHEIPSVRGFQEVMRGTVPTIITRGTVPERLARDYGGDCPRFLITYHGDSPSRNPNGDVGGSAEDERSDEGRGKSEGELKRKLVEAETLVEGLKRILWRNRPFGVRLERIRLRTVELREVELRHAVEFT